ncbi:MAG: hypothetical protein DKM50_11555 [Candidatus Margulisiibacteriota bacterium]|nr:MAG: hypothetical protein DKM50_11555 [Candidatus Margulisiibacteriota bacterium]
MKLFADKYNRIFMALFVAYVLIFTVLSFLRFDTHKTYLNDLGNMDQAVWSTLHGKFLHQSNTADGLLLTRFNEHFDPVLLVFVPFYFIWASPLWLLFFQTLAIAVGAIPLYLLAKKRLSPFFAVLLTACYFLYPALENANLYDFHPIVLAVPVISFMIWAIIEERMKLFWILAILLLLIKEEMPLTLVGMGMYLLTRKKYMQGFAAVFLGAIAFVLVMKVIIPSFSPLHEHPLLAGGSNLYGSGYVSRFAWLGTSLGEILHTLFARPMYVLKTLCTQDRGSYLMFLGFPLMLLPFFTPVLLISIPTIAINLLDSTEMMHSLFFYHSAVVAPVFFLGAVMVLEKIKYRKPQWSYPVLTGIVGISLIIHLTQGLLPYSVAPLRYYLQDFYPQQHYKEVAVIKKIIPPDASVSVQQNLGIYFAQRLEIYRFPLKAESVDYVVMDLTNSYYGEVSKARFDYMLLITRPQIAWKLFSLVDNNSYGVYYHKDGYLVLKKGYYNIHSRQILENIIKNFYKA